MTKEIIKEFCGDNIRYGYYNLHGKFITHRDEKDGPAVICSNGTEIWCINGKRHRENGPAAIYQCGAEEWCINDKPHREDGPARIYPNGTEQWWIDGEPVTHKLEKWFKERNINKNDIRWHFTRILV